MKSFFFRHIVRSVVFLAASVPFVASACPLCNTPTGQQVRAGIFDHDFGMTLLSVIAPFPIFLFVLAAMHFVLTHFGQRAPVSTANHHSPTDTNT